MSHRHHQRTVEPGSATAKAIIGTVLDFPETLPKAIAAGITAQSFQSLEDAAAWRAIAKMHADGIALNDVSLIERLNGSPELNGSDRISLVQSFHAQSISGAQIDALCDDLKRAQLGRQLSQFGDTLKSLKLGPEDDPAAVLADVESSWRGLFVETGADLPAIVDAADFVAQSRLEPEQLVKGILHKGSKLVLGGGSKSFKTWMLLDLALSVAHGCPWLGFETEPGPVLYLNFEIQDYAWQRRLATIATAKQIELRHGPVKLWNLRGKAADFQSLIPRIVAQARSLGFSLIVLDPIYKLYGQTDENKAGDVARLLNSIEHLAVSTGTAVAFGAHFAKGNAAGKEAIDRISGSGVFARDPDSILVFTPHEVKEAFGVECILRNFAPIQPFAVRWDFPLMRRDGELDPSKLKKAGGRSREHTPEALLDVLGGDSLTSTEWQIRAKDDTGMGERTFYTLKAALQKAGLVLQSKINRKWQRVLKR